MDNKTDDMNPGLVPSGPDVRVKSELTDERLGHETPDTPQDLANRTDVKNERVGELNGAVELPSFGVDIVPQVSLGVHEVGLNNGAPKEDLGPAVRRVEESATHIAPQQTHIPSNIHPTTVGAMVSGTTTASETWRTRVLREERAQQVAVLYGLLKQRYDKNIDDKVKDQLVTLAQRVENAWFHKAESKV